VRLDHLVTALAQRELDHLTQPLFIVNNQDFFHGKCESISAEYSPFTSKLHGDFPAGP
jgi:hypothetical protein